MHGLRWPSCVIGLFRYPHSPEPMLNTIALILLIFVALFLFYGLIILHDIPYEIAKKRKHPHQDAIHVAGWVSLMTLHVIWPFLWIWAMLYREDRGWGTAGPAGEGGGGLPQPGLDEELKEQLDTLSERVAELESRLGETETKS